MAKPKPTFRPLSRFKPREVEWFWKPYIPAGMITIMEGDPGEGKSFLAMYFAAMVSVGGKLPDGSQLELGTVLYISAEDDPCYTIRPRVDAMGGDAMNVRVLVSDLTLDADGFDKLRAELNNHDITLIIIDPLMAFMPEKTDVHRSNAVRPILSTMKVIAEEFGCAVLFIRHLTKMKHDKAIYQGGGSIDFIGAARSALLVTTNPADEEQKVVLHIKHNVGPKGQSWAYRLVSGPKDSLPRVKWDGPSSVTINDLAIGKSSGSPAPRDDAADFLRNFLNEGPRKASDVEKAAAAAAITKRTLIRAKQDLGIKSNQRNREWWWRLPD